MLEIKNYIQDNHRVSIEWICGELIHTHFSKTSTNKRRLAFYIAYLLYCFAPFVRLPDHFRNFP